MIQKIFDYIINKIKEEIKTYKLISKIVDENRLYLKKNYIKNQPEKKHYGYKRDFKNSYSKNNKKDIALRNLIQKKTKNLEKRITEEQKKFIIKNAKINWDVLRKDREIIDSDVFFEILFYERKDTKIIFANMPVEKGYQHTMRWRELYFDTVTLKKIYNSNEEFYKNPEEIC